MSNITTSRQLTRTTKYRLNNGQHIPVAGFGVYLVPKADASALVYEALTQGYRHIDSAIVYGNERESAQGIAKFLEDNKGKVSREDIWFTTKVFNNDQGYEETKKAIEGTASRVKEYLGYVDMVLIHSPKTNKEKRIGTYKALQEFVTDPANETLRINTIGVSNYGIRHLEELFNWDGLVVHPAVDQLELHPWLPQIELREYLASKNILVEAYSPLTQGEKFRDPELLELEHTYKIPKAEILLKWSYLQGFIVLAKTSSKERIIQNLSVLPEAKAPADTLDDTSHSGKIDLDINILEALNKPDSKEVLTWGGVDPTLYEG